jgi:HK97 gp10 family phage protein
MSRVTTTVRIEGLAELDKKLRGLGPKIARKALGYSVSQGARIIRNEAKARAPVRTGVLRRAIYYKRVSEASTPWSRTYIVGVRRGKKYQKRNQDAFYFPFVEFDTVRTKGRYFVTNAFVSRQADAARAIAEALERKTMEYAEKPL